LFFKVFLTSRPNVKDNAHTLQVLTGFWATNSRYCKYRRVVYS